MRPVEYVYIGNKIPPEEAADYMRKAYLYLKNITLGRVDAAPEDEGVSIAVSEIAEAMYITGNRFGIASENNDGYSVSFTGDTPGRTFYRIAARYLPPGMLSRRCDMVW